MSNGKKGEIVVEVSPAEQSRKTQSWNVRGERFLLDERYNVLDYLGSGAYGVVCAAFDNETKEYVAVKKCRKIFHSRTMAKRALREMRILRLLDHDNVVRVKDLLKPADDMIFTELYIVFELMETDLAMIIRSSQTLRDQHLQYFIYQLLCGLQYLQNRSIVHRDIKPRNLLVNTNCQLKIADFGLARVYNATNERRIAAMTEYVTTRWYRAPEVIVGWFRYDYAVDMWAAGTILAELLGRQPIFSGSDSTKQLDLIIRTLGRPDDSFIDSCRKPIHRKYLRTVTLAPPRPLRERYPSCNPHAVELLEGLLVLHPTGRPTASEALEFNWMRPMLDGSETDLPIKVTYQKGEFAFEDGPCTTDIIRQEMLRDIRWYEQHPSPTSKAVEHSFKSSAKTSPSRVEYKESIMGIKKDKCGSVPFRGGSQEAAAAGRASGASAQKIQPGYAQMRRNTYPPLGGTKKGHQPLGSMPLEGSLPQNTCHSEASAVDNAIRPFSDESNSRSRFHSNAPTSSAANHTQSPKCFLI